MGNFNRDDKRSGGGFRRRFDGDASSGGGRRPMNPATCSACGASCEVPFKPTGDRPVYCRDCFAKQKGGGSRSDTFGGERSERPRFDEKRMHDAVCVKCGNNCQVPFRPVAGKPIYCSNCFDKGGSGKRDVQDSGAVAEQLKMLNIKIDKLMTLLTPRTLEAKNDAVGAPKEGALEEGVKEKKKTKGVPKKSPSKKKK